MTAATPPQKPATEPASPPVGSAVGLCGPAAHPSITVKPNDLRCRVCEGSGLELGRECFLCCGTGSLLTECCMCGVKLGEDCDARSDDTVRGRMVTSTRERMICGAVHIDEIAEPICDSAECLVRAVAEDLRWLGLDETPRLVGAPRVVLDAAVAVARGAE